MKSDAEIEIEEEILKEAPIEIKLQPSKISRAQKRRKAIKRHNSISKRTKLTPMTRIDVILEAQASDEASPKR